MHAALASPSRNPPLYLGHWKYTRMAMGLIGNKAPRHFSVSFVSVFLGP